MIYINGVEVSEEEEQAYREWVNENPEEVNMYD